MKTTKLFMTFAVFIGAAAYACAESASTAAAPGQPKMDTPAELQSMSFEALINKTKAAKNRVDKDRYAVVIRKKLPATESEKQAALKFLDSDNSDDKVIAIEILARIKEKRAVPAMIKELKSKENRVRVMAVGALGEIGDERAIDPLLENPDSMILEFGQCPVAKIGAPALPKLVEIAKKSNLLDKLSPKARKDRKSRYAASCIGRITDEKAKPGLMKLLKDDDAEVRLGAVRALASMKAKEAEPEFERLLQDSNEDVRMATLRSLAISDNQKYLPKVIEATESSSLIQKMKAIDLLGEIGDKASVGKLESFLKDPEEIIRHRAAFSLWKTNGKIYAYEKGQDTLRSEQFWKKRLDDARKPGRDHESPQNAIREAQNNGFLLDEKAE